MTPTSSPYLRSLVWLRRDLRLSDHAALSQALAHSREVHVAFVYDTDILDPLPRRDRRVAFIHAALAEVDEGLRRLSGQAQAGLIVRHGRAQQTLPELAQALGVQAVWASHDDEPASLARDAQVRGALAERGVALHTVKDHVLFERQEVLTQAGLPYSVFTPYKNAWLRRFVAQDAQDWPVAPMAQRLAPRPPACQQPLPSLAELGFEPVDLAALHLPTGERGAQQLLADFLQRIDAYDQRRDFPAVKGPSYLSVHLRFGTISIRELVRQAHPRAQGGSSGAQVWLSELIWRDFYAQVLANFPQVGQGKSFRAEYDQIAWERGAHARQLMAAWSEGRTGYPLVDAAMRQLNQTGYMHNRLRMVVASFLCKDLGVDWRWGEKYFATHLNDFDLSANNGGWQWASSSGCDAQPYFRIFNPVSQSEKFDPQGRFIRRYLPQLAGLSDKAIHAAWEAAPLELAAAGVELGVNYPRPLVAHDEARARTLARYAVVKKTAN